jgi:hypothetical protein
MTTEVTPTQALVWLAGLEKDGVPVLDLREPCTIMHQVIWSDGRTGGTRSCTHEEYGCSGWFLKQGRQDIQDAMAKVGYWYDIHQHGEKRTIAFYLPGQGAHPRWGEDADDHIAAMKTMKVAGYE